MRGSLIAARFFSKAFMQAWRIFFGPTECGSPVFRYACRPADPSKIMVWNSLTTGGQEIDQLMIEWSDSFAVGPVAGDLNSYSRTAGRDVAAPLGPVLPHIFNHQSQHRGQVHAMLYAAGCKTTDFDLFLMTPAEWQGSNPHN